jgi:1,4-dihydroxy-2-naphthoyl-CoA hydrolase
MKFVSQNRVRMYDTDACQILFFAKQFRFSHDAWEELMIAEGFGFDYLNREDVPFTMVMVHCEADYKHRLAVGDKLEVHTSVAKIGTTSFTIFYEIFRDGLLVGSCTTVQVTLDRRTLQKIPIPSDFKSSLEKYID